MLEIGLADDARSPCDDPKACGGAYRSSPTTRMPRRAASHAIALPCNAETENDCIEHDLTTTAHNAIALLA
jgi:hypothetical protein